MASRRPAMTRSAAKRLGRVALLAVVALAFIGYAVGLRQGMAPREDKQVIPAGMDEGPTEHAVPIGPPQAVGYRELPSAQLTPNAGRVEHLQRLQVDREDLFSVSEQSSAEKQKTLESRAGRRAYSGAPPVIPHAVPQRDAAACLACHGKGLKAGDLTAPAISHPEYTNCTQCHVESANNAFPESAASPFRANLFEGLQSPEQGERAWPGAPPTIPHTTWMRQNCLSCHGPTGAAGIRSTHPWRANCRQCHVPSAELDQRYFNTFPPLHSEEPAP